MDRIHFFPTPLISQKTWRYRTREENRQGESSMWGDYHGRELAILIQSVIEGKTYQRFFNGLSND